MIPALSLSPRPRRGQHAHLASFAAASSLSCLIPAFCFPPGPRRGQHVHLAQPAAGGHHRQGGLWQARPAAHLPREGGHPGVGVGPACRWPAPDPCWVVMGGQCCTGSWAGLLHGKGQLGCAVPLPSFASHGHSCPCKYTCHSTYVPPFLLLTPNRPAGAVRCGAHIHLHRRALAPLHRLPPGLVQSSLV